VSDRATLTGIVFVLRSGIPWKMLPREMGCGSGVTCWRRLKAWQRAGVWKRLHQVLLSKLRQAERIDFSRAVADSSSIRALGAGKKLDRTQPIAVVRARNTTSSSTRKAFRSRPF
jgi:transposase